MDEHLITDFRGPYRWLSNFHLAPVALVDDHLWPSVEHAYQAAKCRDLEDRALFVGVTCARAKQIGRTVALRPDWDEVKVVIMRELVTQKFVRHDELRAKLLATGNTRLVEGNTWHDNFWGDCHCEKCQLVLGQNYLGRILMDVRSQLMEPL